MLYTVLGKDKERDIRLNSQFHACRGDRVWKTLREARLWRDHNEPAMGVFGVLACWETDTKIIEGKNYRFLKEIFKVVHLTEAIPGWLKDVIQKIVKNSYESDLLDKGFINPDYVTPEQEATYYEKHRDEVMFQLRCLITLSIFEELEVLGLAGKERGKYERQDTSGNDTDIFGSSGS